MSGLKRRLEAVEESVRAETAGRFSDEGEEKRRWMARARVRRNEDRDPDEFQARDLFRLFHTQGRLGATADAAIAQILSWPTKPPGRRASTPQVTYL